MISFLNTQTNIFWYFFNRYWCQPLFQPLYPPFSKKMYILRVLPWFTTVYHGLPPFTMVYHGLPWFTTVYHRLPLYTMVYHRLRILRVVRVVGLKNDHFPSKWSFWGFFLSFLQIRRSHPLIRQISHDIVFKHTD